MDKKLVELLLPIVNDASVMDALLAYTEYRMGLSRVALETASEIHPVAQAQGKIAELRAMLKLRDIVNAKSKEFRQ